MDRDRTVSGFITRIVTVLSVNNYQHWGTVVNLAFTDWLSLLACLIRQGKSVLSLKALATECTGFAMKSDERRWCWEEKVIHIWWIYRSNESKFLIYERVHLSKCGLRQNCRASRAMERKRKVRGRIECSFGPMFLKTKTEVQLMWSVETFEHFGETPNWISSKWRQNKAISNQM